MKLAIVSSPVAVPTYNARIMSNGQLTTQISLDGHTYTLRITKARKLILTK
jgi:hemin uptake protein HemP